VKDNKRQA